jgi:hypothetical protein
MHFQVNAWPAYKAGSISPSTVKKRSFTIAVTSIAMSSPIFTSRSAASNASCAITCCVSGNSTPLYWNLMAKFAEQASGVVAGSSCGLPIAAGSAGCDRGIPCDLLWVATALVHRGHWGDNSYFH